MNYKGYIYYKNIFGECLGYISDEPAPSIDMMQVVLIATRNNSEEKWIQLECVDVLVDMERVLKYEIYEDKESFFSDFMEAFI